MVSIRQTFTIPTAIQDGAQSSTPSTTTKPHTFDASNVIPATIGLNAGSSPTKAEPGSYVYTGMHDHGEFPRPKEGGPMAVLVGCADEAKKASDKLLTQVIDTEKTTKGEGGGANKKRSADGTKKSG